MRRFFHVLGVLLAASVLPIAAQAQCTGGLISNCPAATSPQGTDVLLGAQSAAPTFARKFSLTQVWGAGLPLTLDGWTTSGRPTSPPVNTFGVNTTLGQLEWWNGSAWTQSGGLTTPVSVANGGTGLATLTANGLLIGNGTGTPTFLTPTNGDCAVGSGGVWTVGACGGGGGTPGGAVGQVQYNNSGSFGGFTISQDATLNTSTGALTVTSTNGVPFAPSATTDTTNASNIATGTLNAGLFPNSGVSAGTYGDAADVGQFTVDSTGRITSATTVPITVSGVQLNVANAWTATQTGSPVVVTPSGATYTPTAAAGNNISITLVHASCPCTVANPTGTLQSGTSGMLQITQSSTGSDTIGTWGSDYAFLAGAPPILTSTANSTTYLPYYINGGQVIVGNSTSSGTGTVTSVALALPSIFTVSGSPITTNGTLTGALANETANTVFAGPSTGSAAAPTFRALVTADLPTANTWAGQQTFSGGYILAVSSKSGAYTVASTDCGTLIKSTSSTAVTFTLPNSLPIGCPIGVEQDGAGQVTFSAASGATLLSAHSYTKTFGQYAEVQLTVKANAGSAAQYVLSGDGA